MEIGSSTPRHGSVPSSRHWAQGCDAGNPEPVCQFSSCPEIQSKFPSIWFYSSCAALSKGALSLLLVRYAEDIGGIFLGDVPGVYRVRADTQESRYDRQNGYDMGEKTVRAAVRCPTHAMRPHEWGTRGMSGLYV
jgi:hypothetical protein